MLSSPSSVPSEMRAVVGQSSFPDTAQAALEIVRKIYQPEIGLIMVFASGCHSIETVCAHIENSYHNVPVIGCNTAGEFGPLGYGAGSIVAISIHQDDICFEAGLLEDISNINQTDAREFAARLARRLGSRHVGILHNDIFALMFIDGSSVLEETVARAFQDGLGGAQLVGGTIGSESSQSGSKLFYNGKTVTNGAVLLVGYSFYPFEAFKIQHFESKGAPLVVTKSQPSSRVVLEINGYPAAQEYAFAVEKTLHRKVFDSTFLPPLLTRIGNEVFVRSIRQLTQDEGLLFYCSIEEGAVLRVAQSNDMVTSMKNSCADISNRLGSPTVTLGFDCILRSREMYQSHLQDKVLAILQDINAVGFCSLGEQYHGVHVNQTLTGIAFGRRLWS